MPIVKMDKMTLVGLADEREAIIAALMQLGAVEVIPQSAEHRPERCDGDPVSLHDRVNQTQSAITRLEKIITLAKKLNPAKKPMFTVRRRIESADFLDVTNRENQIMAQVSQFEHNLAQLDSLRFQQHRLQVADSLLEPWQDLDLDLAVKGTEHVRMFLGSFDGPDKLAQLEVILSEEAPESLIHILTGNETSQRCIVATWRPSIPLVKGHLHRLGFSPLPLQGESGTPRQILDQNKIKLDEIAASLAQISQDNNQLATSVQDYETLLDYLVIRQDRLQEVAQLAGTRSTFWLQGWVPSHLTSAIAEGLASRFLIAVESRHAEKTEDFPILLKNSRLVKPFEVVAEMFSAPSSQEIDPSPWVAPFYFFFFGIMLSDIGYGLILTAICAFLLYKVKVEGNMKRMSTLLLLCGIASTIWGFLFGGFFGDMLSVLSNKQIILPALWFNPMDDPTSLMIWSLLFGVVHIFVGMWVKVLVLFKTGRGKDAILDVIPWYFIIIGLGLMLANIGGSVGSILALVGTAVILLFAGRGAKNPLSRLFKGLGALYNITGYFSDILSYTRILALVLATSVIAMVVNLMGFLLGPTIPGILLFIVVALAGHGLNIALSTLSAYVHTSRLHYVEFFGKFYDGGGRMWQPLTQKTKYVEIKK